MATFPDSPSERGGARFGGGGLGTPLGVPGKPKVASLFTPQPGGNQTLQALMLRQKELAARGGGEMPQIQSWTQGLAHALGQTMTGFEQGRVDRDIATGNKVVADVIGGADPVTGEYGPDAAAKVAQWNPDFAAKILADRQARANAEHWEDMPPPPGAKEGQLYQRNSVTGEVRTAGGAAGTSVTINPPSAETGAKLGLANGFLDNYDAIIASAQAGEMTGGGYISGVQLGRGNGGAQYRNLLQGTEAMVRLLTGAGMSEGEARQRVVQYEPALTDDADTLVSKIQGLKQALNNVTEGVQTRGQDQEGEGDPATTETNPYKVGETYDFTTPDGKPIRGTYLGGDIGAASSWKAAQ
jgi:hypothetical protein